MKVQSLKKPKLTGSVLYALLTLLLFGGIGAFTLLRSLSGSTVFLLMQLFSLGFGVAHVRLLYRFFPRLNEDDVIPGALTTLALNAGGALSMAASLRYLGNSLGFAGSAILFSLPFFFVKAFQRYRQIPPKVYKKWYYPLNHKMPDLDLLDLTKILVIQFEFSKLPDETNYTNFKAKAPVEMPFGELFFIFINDYNEQNPNSPVHYADAQVQPFGWVFYRKTSWWQSRRYFDPDVSFKENQVADNDIIVCERA